MSEQAVDNNNSCSCSIDSYEPEYEPETIYVRQDLSFEILSVVPPPLEYMSKLHSQNQEISGRQVWTGSLLLANFWLQFYDEQRKGFDKQFLSNARILELGSGTGILGMTISKTISERVNTSKDGGIVLLSDGDEKAVELIHSNLQNDNNPIDTDRVKSIQLLWWDDDNNNDSSTMKRNEFLQNVRRLYRNSQNDANNNGDDDQNVPEAIDTDQLLFDCIVAGDVLYKAELPSLFFHTAFTLLKKKSTSENCLWLCHVPRHGVTHEIVQSAAIRAGFHYEIQPTDTIELSTDYCPIEDSSRAIVYKMSRAATINN